MDKIQSDFSILSVSHVAGGTLSIGDQGARKVCKGKHLPAWRTFPLQTPPSCRQGTPAEMLQGSTTLYPGTLSLALSRAELKIWVRYLRN